MLSPTTKAVAVKLESTMRDRIAKLAEERKSSAHALMRDAIHEYVEREEKREAFHQEALKSWEEYRETGLHVTGDEVTAWLETWGSDDEKEAPLCHE